MNRNKIMLAADKAGLTPVMEMFEAELFHFARLITEWVGLTDEEIYEAEDASKVNYRRHMGNTRGQIITPADNPSWHLALAIEAKLKEKNQWTTSNS